MSTNNIQQQVKESSTKDKVLWASALVLLAAGIAADFYFGSFSLALRLATWLVIAVVIILLAIQTKKGKKFWGFAKETRNELRKVVWPTRQEAIRTTAIVALLVLIAVLVMWGIDSILMLLISWLIK